MSIHLVKMLTIPFFQWRIKVRERLAREDGRQRSPELGNVTDAPVYRRQIQHSSQMSARYNTDPPGLQQPCAQRYTDFQATHAGPAGGQEVAGYPSYLSMASSPMSRSKQKQQQAQEEETEGTKDVKTEGLLKSRKAVLPSEIRRRERSTEDPWRGRAEEDLGMSRVKNHSQTREGETDNQIKERHRGRARLDETEHTSRVEAAKNRSRERDNSLHLHKWDPAAHNQPRVADNGAGNSFYLARDLQGPSQRNLQPQDEGFSNGEIHQDPRVSVAQLRHSYMESTTTPPTNRRNQL